MVHGRLRLGDERRSQGYSPLVREGRTWWDASKGFLAPDTLEALREEAGKRPMVAEWMDVGEGSGWEAFDDGSRPYVHLVNSDAQCQVPYRPGPAMHEGCQCVCWVVTTAYRPESAPATSLLREQAR